MYTATLTNDYCASTHVASQKLGGLNIEENVFNFPEEVLGWMRSEIMKYTGQSPELREYAELRIYVKLQMTVVPSGLRKAFAESYSADIPQRFRASNPLDQRPAVRSYELAPPLLGVLRPFWQPEHFSLYQDAGANGDRPVLFSLEIAIDDHEAIEQIVELIGYGD
jgi:hypothetical protein